MALNFLCSVHRDWVYFHPQDALAQLEAKQQRGEKFMQMQEWQEAIKILGCAFETTEILIEIQDTKKTFLLSILTTLAMLLATSFAELNAMSYGQLILKQAQQKLQMIANNSLGNQPKYDHVEQCLMAVKNRIEQLVFMHPLAQDMSTAQVH